MPASFFQAAIEMAKRHRNEKGEQRYVAALASLETSPTVCQSGSARSYLQ